METTDLEPDQVPTAVFVKPQVGYDGGVPTMAGGFAVELQDREAYYASTHLQTIKFEIAREVVRLLTEAGGAAKPKLAMRSRHHLFPQVYRVVDAYVSTKVNPRGCDMRELGLQTYSERVVGLLVAAIEPNDAEGELPLLPILNRYKAEGSTADVDFKTTRPCVATTRSHIDQVVADTNSWEQAAVFRLEASKHVDRYARNDHLELAIPYDFMGISHSYLPDFLVGLKNGVNLLLEIKGQQSAQDQAKHQAAQRWVSAVNHWGRMGTWRFHVCRDPQQLDEQLAAIV